MNMAASYYEIIKGGILLCLATIMTRVNRFKEYGNAKNYANNSLKVLIILYGDNNQYWVCSIDDAEKLIRMGYEVVR